MLSCCKCTSIRRIVQETVEKSDGFGDDLVPTAGDQMVFAVDDFQFGRIAIERLVLLAAAQGDDAVLGRGARTAYSFALQLRLNNIRMPDRMTASLGSIRLILLLFSECQYDTKISNSNCSGNRHRAQNQVSP